MPIAELFVSLFAPHECLVCGHEGAVICPGCTYDAIDSVPSRCFRCLAVTRDAAVCSKCRKASALKSVWVTTDYEGAAKQIIHKLKFERAQAAHRPIAELMADTLPYLSSQTIITHIPTATSRYRARGYDQSRLVAAKLAKLKGVKHVSLLERYGQSRQVGATKQRRHEQAQDMFRLCKKELVSETEVILVDDILTTGSSIEAAAKLLKQAGVKHISAAVFAQKH